MSMEIMGIESQEEKKKVEEKKTNMKETPEFNSREATSNQLFLFVTYIVEMVISNIRSALFCF